MKIFLWLWDRGEIFLTPGCGALKFLLEYVLKFE
jgi:hypothetical protein